MAVDEVAPDTYRISTYVPEINLQFNQFLVKDDEPLLYHTGMRGLFPRVLEEVSRVIDPRRLRWVGFSHFESDECGALNDWLEVAPRAEPVCGFVGALVSVNDFALRPARVLADGETLSTGRRLFRFLQTPHVPHCWEASLLFEETEGTLLCSDLFTHGGDVAPSTESDVVGPFRQGLVADLEGPMAGAYPYTPQTDATLRRLAELRPKTLALMHGSTFVGDGRTALLDLAAAMREVLSA
ncbi:MAG: MBL fold metallo-hydrolase [Acidobacteria bacterium]|nr:MBL fold metallo-hydrolase [Acidobacteriota bacterium]